MNATLKLQWRQLQEKFAALQVREQALIAAAGAALVLVLCDQLLWSPLARANSVRSARIGELRSQQQNLLAQQAAVTARLRQDPDAELRASLDAVKARLAAQNQQLQEKTAGLIPPEKMAGVLHEVLKSRAALTLLELRNEPAVPAFKPQTAPAEGAESTSVSLYRHGMTLQLRGSYFEIVAYLQALEQLDWHFYWQELNYKVTTYPNAEVTLKVYTLSNRESWIGA